MDILFNSFLLRSEVNNYQDKLFGLGGGANGPPKGFAKYLKNGLANLYETL